MLFASCSTTVCARNSSIQIGSPRSLTFAFKPQHGGATTTPTTLTARLAISPPKSLPGAQRTSLKTPSFLESSRSKIGEKTRPQERPLRPGLAAGANTRQGRLLAVLGRI